MRMMLEVFIDYPPVLQALIDEFYKMAGKAGNNYGKAHPEDQDGNIPYPRDWWLKHTQELHAVIDQLEGERDEWAARRAAGEGQFGIALTMVFTRCSVDFLEFLKTELAASAGRLGKEAWLQYSPSARNELLKRGPFLISRLRDQVIEFSQPRLIDVETTPGTDSLVKEFTAAMQEAFAGEVEVSVELGRAA